MKKTRVGVVRGGPSSEYEVSLSTGAAVLKNLPDHYEPIDIFIGRDGIWHVHGVRHSIPAAFRKVDVVFNAMHGEFGEDGQVQELFDKFGVKYTGSKAFPSRLAMNKALTKEFVAKGGIKTPIARLISKGEYDAGTAGKLYRSFPQPSVIKPMALGSSVGVAIAQTVHELESALENAFKRSDSVLIEEYISGKEATCGVVERFNNSDLHALPPVEIVPKSSTGFFDYDAKYLGKSEEICPGRFSAEERTEIERLAAEVHKIMGLRHYSRSDFIIHPRRGIYFLEVNTLPGLTEASLLPKAVAASGSSLGNFLDHIIKQALEG
ncbi:MAG: D-alanine--D-alanine ligase [Candidatus Taylorbacteria bacterium]|nr:D-alanine--D-alanine ligase [Candidatus Taylorbacteria bacterium]